MKLWSGIALAASMIACGGEQSVEVTPVQFDPPPAEAEVDSNTRVATVHWTLIGTTCPHTDSLPFDSSGTVNLEGDAIVLGLSSMPDLSGRVVDGRADVGGVMTFQGTREMITCSVQGVATV